MKPESADLTPLPAQSFWQQVKGLFLLLREGVPQPQPVHHSYNTLRQEYILHAARHHFGKRADDPAPLFRMDLLDVGCGATPINSFMVLSGADVTAVDTDPQVIAAAQAYADSIGTAIRFQTGAMDVLLPEDKEYDVILCLDILEYVQDTERFFWSLHKLLKPGGLLVFSAINRSFLSWFVHVFISERILHRTPAGSRRWNRFYRPDQVRQMMRIHGLNVLTIQGMQFDPTEQEWRLTHTPGTRYLGTATKL